MSNRNSLWKLLARTLHTAAYAIERSSGGGCSSHILLFSPLCSFSAIIFFFISRFDHDSCQNMFELYTKWMASFLLLFLFSLAEFFLFEIFGPFAYGVTRKSLSLTRMVRKEGDKRSFCRWWILECKQSPCDMDSMYLFVWNACTNLNLNVISDRI